MIVGFQTILLKEKETVLVPKNEGTLIRNVSELEFLGKKKIFGGEIVSIHSDMLGATNFEL